MSTAWLEESLGDPSALLQLAADNHAAERLAGCRKLMIAAAWADCHGETGDAGDSGVLTGERFIRIGPVGTPRIGETCPASLALPHQSGPVAARVLIGDALTIRHRLPRLWERVQAGEVWAWKARKIAQRSSEFSLLSARIVDRLLSPQVELMGWGRFDRVLNATLLQVDETTYQRRAARAAAERDVRATQSTNGLRTLVARLESGDATMFVALVNRVADCLAEDGDEDPVGVRRSKAFGIIAHQARLRDLLARHADQPDDPRHPEERVAAHQADPSDPWAADDLPPAGWETATHGNMHQPTFDDLNDDCWTGQTPEPDPGWDEEPPIPATDQAWYAQQQGADDGHDAADGSEGPTPPTGAGQAAAAPTGSPPPSADDQNPAPAPTPSPAAFRRCSCQAGSLFDLRPFTPSETAASRPRVVIHVHVTDRTLIDRHGVVRTDDGPVTLDQFRQWLTDTDPNITVRPVLDPAGTAAVDAYEIPQSLRQAITVRHPGSVWPYSPTTKSRVDLDHTIPYNADGPPGQTSMDNLGPLTRTEHRAKTHGGWQGRQPHPGHYLWRSPDGLIALTTNQGTLLLGGTPWAHQIWNTTVQPAESQSSIEV